MMNLTARESYCILRSTKCVINRFMGRVTQCRKYGNIKKSYASAWNFSTREELMKELLKDVLYLDLKEGVVVINKPHGLPLNKTDDSQFCLTDCLVDLAASFEVKSLEAFKVPPRYNSGCAVFVTSSKAKQKLEKCRLSNFHAGIFDEKCVAITLGNPRLTNVTEVVDVTPKAIPGKRNFKNLPLKETVISRDLVSIRKFEEIKRLGGFRAHVRSTTLSRSGFGNATLVSLEATTNRNNLYLAYMASILSPILGDRFYNYRVKNLMGKPISLSHEHSPGMPMAQPLPLWMLDCLKLSSSDLDLVPQHIHLSRTYFKNFYGKDKPLKVYAPIPKYFRDSISSLNFTFDWESFISKDEVVKIDPMDRVKKQKKSKQEVEIIPPENAIPYFEQQLLSEH